jgi:hypothetical protein
MAAIPAAKNRKTISRKSPFPEMSGRSRPSGQSNAPSSLPFEDAPLQDGNFQTLSLYGLLPSHREARPLGSRWLGSLL